MVNKTSIDTIFSSHPRFLSPFLAHLVTFRAIPITQQEPMDAVRSLHRHLLFVLYYYCCITWRMEGHQIKQVYTQKKGSTWQPPLMDFFLSDFFLESNEGWKQKCLSFFFFGWGFRATFVFCLPYTVPDQRSLIGLFRHQNLFCVHPKVQMMGEMRDKHTCIRLGLYMMGLGSLDACQETTMCDARKPRKRKKRHVNIDPCSPPHECTKTNRFNKRQFLLSHFLLDCCIFLVSFSCLIFESLRSYNKKRRQDHLRPYTTNTNEYGVNEDWCVGLRSDSLRSNS